MNDQRNLTMGLQFETDKPISQLSGIIETIQEIKSGFMEMGQGAGEFGSQAAKSAGMVADSMEELSGSGEKVQKSYQDMGISVDGFEETAIRAGSRATASMEDVSASGKSVQKAYQDMGASARNFEEAVIGTSAKAITETNSLSKTIRAGVQGAYGFAEKKVKNFGTQIKAGASGVKNAILHPLQTIRDKLSDALGNAQRELDDTGDEAKQTGAQLKDMGSDGERAGTRIKDAVGSAVKSFLAISVGIELFKAGIGIVKNFAGAIMNAGMEAEQTGAKFEAMFNMDSGVKEWAENFSAAIHRSNTEVQGFLVSNKKMYQELGITGEAANDLSRITTSLAYDLGAKFKMDDSEALGVMQDYISGNTDALSEYGIRIDETILKQSAMSMGLGANIESLDEAAMAQVRMNALLENSASIQQAASKKQEGYTNSIKSLKGVWSDFLSSAGEKFAPVFTDLMGTILTSWPQVEPALMGMVDMLSNGLAAGVPVISELALSAIPPLIQTMGELFAAAAPIGGAMLDLATTALPPLASAAMPLIETFGMLAQTVLPPFAKVVGNIASTVVPPLANILKSLSENVIAPLIPYIESIANAILPTLAAGLNMIPPVLEIISPILSGVVMTFIP